MKKAIPIRTDDNGRLLDAPYEDGRLDSFHLTRTGLHLGLRARDQSLTELKMSNLVSLCTEPLWEAMIVNDIHVWKAMEGPLPFWQALEKGRGTDDSLTGVLTRYFPQFAEFWLVHVGSDYGGGFTCLCQKVELFHTPS